MPVTFSEDDFKQTSKNPLDTLGKSQTQAEEQGAIPYVAKRLARGTTSSLGGLAEAGASAIAGESPAYAALRAFLPREWVDKVKEFTPFMPGGMAFGPGDKSAEARGPDKAYSPEGLQDRFVGDVGKAPGDLSNAAGAMAEGVGSVVGNPIGAPAKIGKAVVMGAGAGLGGELGGTAGESIGGDAGKVVGSIAGGMIGAQANAMRMNALKPVGKVAEAAVSAAKAKIKGDPVAFSKLFSSKMDDLKVEGKGLLQKHVMEETANILRNDPRTADSVKEFDEAAKRQGMDPSQFGLSQRTDNALITQAANQLPPKDLKQALEIQQRNIKDKETIVDAYKRATGDGVSAKSTVEAMEDARKTQILLETAINALAEQERAKVPQLNPSQQHEQGIKLADLYADEKAAAQQKTSGMFEEAYKLSGDAKFDLGKVLKEGKGIISQTISKVDPLSVPRSISNLNNRIKSKKPVLMKDVQDALSAIGYDIRDARTEAGGATKVRNLTIISNELHDALKQAPPEAKAALEKARTAYRDEFSPRFKEGLNLNMDRESGSLRGREKIDPAKVAGEYMKNESSMREFDNLFGGKIPGTTRNEAAYGELRKAVESDFAKTIQGKVSEAKVDEFMKSKQHVLDRMPQLRTTLEDRAGKIATYQAEAEQSRNRYREMTGSPLSKAVGPEAADKLVTVALQDPRRMNQLIKSLETHGGTKALMKDMESRMNFFTDGQFNPDKLNDVLTKGEPGLRVLFNAAMGKEAAQTHFQNLKDIELLARRQKVVEGRPVAAGQTAQTSPVLNATGSSAASWAAYIKNFSEGRTGAAYIPTIAGARFGIKKFTLALEEAINKSLTDPKTADAVLELYRTPPTQPVSKQAVEKVLGSTGGASKQFIAYLADHGYIKTNVLKGAQIGAKLSENPPD